MRTPINRVIAISLAILICVGNFSFLNKNNAFADGEIVHMVQLPRAGDPNPTGWGHPAMNFQGGWHMAASDHTTAKSIGEFEGPTAFCIEPGVNLMIGDMLNYNGEEYWNNYPAINPFLTPTQIKEFIGRIFVYGWTGYNNLSWNSGDPDHAQEIAEMLATQYLIWEVIVGDRDPGFNWIKAFNSTSNVTDLVASDHPLRTQIFDHYTRIAKSVQKHVTLPSFMDKEINYERILELSLNSDGFTYGMRIAETKDVINNYDFFCDDPNISLSTSGDELVVSTTVPPVEPVLITAVRKSSFRQATIVCTDSVIGTMPSGQIQDLVIHGEPVADPIVGYIWVKAATGTLEIVKTVDCIDCTLRSAVNYAPQFENSDGDLAGFEFQVKRGDEILGTYFTDSQGRICIPDIPIGLYTVEEVNFSDAFVAPTPNPVTVEVEKDTTVTISFNNVTKLGIIPVEKSNADPVMGDYSLENAEFTVVDSNGEVVDTIVTDADGRGESKPLPLGEYTVFESEAPYGFAVDENIYSRTLSGSLGSEAIVYCPKISVSERPQVGQIKVTKIDADTGGELTGAAYDLLDEYGNLVESLYSNTDSSVVSQELPLGTYIIKETVAPKDYILSQEDFTITIEYAGQETSIVTEEVTLENRKIPTFVLPKTGSDGMGIVRWLLLALCGCGLILCIHMLRNKRKKDV